MHRQLTDKEWNETRAVLRARLEHSTLAEVAKFCNLQPSYLRPLLSGLRSPGSSTGPRLAALCGVALEVPPTAPRATDLWHAARPYKPEKLLVEVTESGVRAVIVRRGVPVREFSGASMGAVSVEMQRCAS